VLALTVQGLSLWQAVGLCDVVWCAWPSGHCCCHVCNCSCHFIFEIWPFILMRQALSCAGFRTQAASESRGAWDPSYFCIRCRTCALRAVVLDIPVKLHAFKLFPFQWTRKVATNTNMACGFVLFAASICTTFMDP